ncbi:MAG: SDR family NAD(P)-dependent oxidoreductase, partial [Ilumatobacteraceae bacterium]
ADASKSPIDLVVNNAGFGTSGFVHELDIDRLSDEIRLNVLALTRISHAALRVMVTRGRGYLLNVSSVASFQPGPGLAVYAATKAYVTSLTEAVHEELRTTGVRVTALCPGLTRTEFQSVSNTGGSESKFPKFAWMDPRTIAKAGLDAVAKGEAIAVPGTLYKGLSALSSVMPRGASRRLSGFLAHLR